VLFRTARKGITGLSHKAVFRYSRQQSIERLEDRRLLSAGDLYPVFGGDGTVARADFHVGNWLNDNDPDALPIFPEAAKLQPNKTLCVYGADEKDSLCPQLAPASVEAHAMAGGHHFDGAYEELAKLILEYTGQ